jgi:hypothetical protein
MFDLSKFVDGPLWIKIIAFTWIALTCSLFVIQLCYKPNKTIIKSEPIANKLEEITNINLPEKKAQILKPNKSTAIIHDVEITGFSNGTAIQNNLPNTDFVITNTKIHENKKGIENNASNASFQIKDSEITNNQIGIQNNPDAKSQTNKK